MKQICPRCEQDYVYQQRIRPLNQVVYLCEECDALWEIGMTLSKETYQDFQSYMQAFGHRGDWSLVERVHNT